MNEGKWTKENERKENERKEKEGRKVEEIEGKLKWKRKETKFEGNKKLGIR